MSALADTLRRFARSERGITALLGVVSLAACVHAAWYDFVADDAYIALRYARNLIDSGELVYNPGERVEGFTSPLWVFLTALGGSVGISLVTVARLLGAVALVATFRGLQLLWRELEPDAPPLLVLLPALLAASAAPLAAWAMSGLETALFGCLLTFSVALFAKSEREGSTRSRIVAGVAAALATLCRPEGAILVALCTLFVAARACADLRTRWRGLAGWVAPNFVLLGGYLGFRLGYYGHPFPNTFYVKTSGEGLFERGTAYLTFAAEEFGWVWIAVIAIATLAPLLTPGAVLRELREAPGRFAAHVSIRALLVTQLAYLARVGGDFLDLYRFLAPFLTIAYCLATSAAYRFVLDLKGSWRWLAVPAGVALLGSHAERQVRMVGEAIDVSAASRKPLGLEPLGWTRLYGERWAAIGRWLHGVARPDDSMAIGAAGAAPYYSGIANLDLFGLNDEYIAHHGRVIGNRPGHQRFASMEYILQRAPTFLFLAPEHTPTVPLSLRQDRYWNGRGYVEAEMRVEREAHGAPETFYQRFLVRVERARELEGRPGFRARLPNSTRRGQ